MRVGYQAKVLMCNCCKCLSPVKIIDLATLLPFSLSHTQYKWPHISMQKKMVETIKAKDLLFFLSSRHSLTRPFGAGNSLLESTSGASAYWPTAWCGGGPMSSM